MFAVVHYMVSEKGSKIISSHMSYMIIALSNMTRLLPKLGTGNELTEGKNSKWTKT